MLDPMNPHPSLHPDYTRSLRPGEGDDFDPATITEPIVEPFQAPQDAEEDEPEEESRANEEADLVRKLEDQWREARAWMGPAHELGNKCHEFYDNEQWEGKQKNAMRQEGRPALVVNKVAKAVDNITGRERATRYDWKAAPMGADEVLAANAMDHGLKAVANQTNAKYAISDAFESAVIGPMGVLDIWYDETNPDEEQIRVDNIPWEEFFFDPFTKRRDLHDCRYTIRVRILDIDLAKSAWPDKADELDAATLAMPMRDKQEVLSDYDNTDDGRPHTGILGEMDDVNDSRDRVTVREHQYWVLERASWIRMPDGRAFDFDPANIQQMAMLQAQGGEYMSGLKRKYYLATCTNKVLLDYKPSPSPYQRFTQVPIWCKRDRDGRPYGLVALMMDAQREINVNLSKANESLRSRHLLYQPGALGATTAEQAAKAISRANFVLEVADVAGVKIGTDAADTNLFIELMDRAEKHLDDIIGNNEASYGDQGNEKSGVAIQARVAQQGLTMGKVFDNLRFARQFVGEMLIALMQKHYTPQKLARIIHSQVAQAAGVGVNAFGQPTGQQPDLTWLGQAMSSPIMQMKFDVQITDVGESATERQAQFQQMSDVLGLLPDQMKTQFLPDLVRATDWVDAEAMAGKLQQMMQAQNQQRPDLREFLNMAFEKMPAAAQQAILQQLGLPTDLTPTPSPLPPPAVDPNTVIKAQAESQRTSQQAAADMVKHAAMLNHNAQQQATDRVHQARQQALDQQHEAGMALLQHQQALQQAQQQADLAPPPANPGALS